MKPVSLAPAAERDLMRLADFLTSKSERAALAAVDAISTAIRSLEQFPERGRPSQVRGRRELIVAYGRYGYVVRYRVTAKLVLVMRIFHGREQR